MQWFRTIPRFLYALVALFVIAQFAGVVSSPLEQAHSAAGTAVAYASHHHADRPRADGHRDDGCAHADARTCAVHTDYCCALHAFFAGILPPAAVIDHPAIAGEALHPAASDVALGLQPGRLHRPPRPRS